MLLLLPVLVQSYSLGNTLPARTRATRCSSVRLAEGKDYMLQELNPAKAGILCVGHPRHPRHPCQALRRCRHPRRPLAAGVADAHSTAQHTQLGHRTRSPLTAHRSPLTARLHPPRRILTWARASQGLRADGFKPNTEAAAATPTSHHPPLPFHPHPDSNQAHAWPAGATPTTTRCRGSQVCRAPVARALQPAAADAAAGMTSPPPPRCARWSAARRAAAAAAALAGPTSRRRRTTS